MSRLVELKRMFINQKGAVKQVSANDANWLIQQTERVKELEEYNELAYNRIVKVEKQNQRYEQALEFYADKKNYEITGEKTYIGHGDFTEETWIEVDRDKGQKARKALGGNDNE